MVTIIKNNVPRYKITCETCGSILGFMNEDIVKGVHKDNDVFETQHWYEFLKSPCPYCGERIILSIDNKKEYKEFYG
jgi:DNA-directed RNA polymerase subunit RPC12/RpoP